MDEVKSVFTGLFIALLALVTVDHWHDIKLEKQYFLKDAAKVALDLNVSPTTVMDEFENPEYGTIKLTVGERDSYGFRHILALHSPEYLPYEEKVGGQFDKNTRGKEIIRAIYRVYKQAIKYDGADFFGHGYKVYIGATKVDDNYNTYVLVVKRYGDKILTFFPVDELDDFDLQLDIARDLSGVYSFPKAYLVDGDLGDYVEKKSVDDDELLDSMYNPKYGWIKLYVGNSRYGFRHILMRHTTRYFRDYPEKNNATMFNQFADGTDIWRGMRQMYEHAALVELYNSAFDRNEVYVGVAQIGGDPERCLLVVRKYDKKIVTFYPLSLKREEDLRDEYLTRYRFYYEWD